MPEEDLPVIPEVGVVLDEGPVEMGRLGGGKPARTPRRYELLAAGASRRGARIGRKLSAHQKGIVAPSPNRKKSRTPYKNALSPDRPTTTMSAWRISGLARPCSKSFWLKVSTWR